MDALQVIQKAVGLTNLTAVPTTITGSDDPQIVNLRAVLSDVGQDLTSRHDWNSLGRLFSFTSGSTSPHIEPLPSDWGKGYPDASVWRSGAKLFPMSGPVPPDVWHRLLVMPGIRFPGYWRPFDGNLEVIGAPEGETVSIYYVRDGWVQDANGSVKQEVTKDDDTFLLPDRVLSLGIISRWRRYKGLSYAEEMADFEYELERQIAADRMSRPIYTTWPYRASSELRTWPGVILPQGLP